MRRKLYIKKEEKQNGFTLIEVLSVVVIIAIISGISITIYLNTINKSKENATNLAINNIKSAAELYSKESNTIDWLNVYDKMNPTKQYICMTVNDLINTGYLKKDFFKEELYKNTNINGNTYFRIIKDYQNKSLINIEVLPETSNQKQCEIDINNLYSNIKLKNSNSYTDTIILELQLEDKTDRDYYCYLQENKTNLIPIDNNSCTFNNLKNKEKYNPVTCYKIEGIEGDYCSALIETKTKDFISPTITINKNWKQNKDVTIKFSNDNIYNEEGKHYFKSDVSGKITNGTVYQCHKEQDNLTCDTTKSKATTITNNVWYFSKELELTFNVTTNIEDDNNKKIYAFTKDKTGNNSEIVNEVINKIDNIPPQCNINFSAPIGTNDYYKSNVTIKLDTNDTSGIAKYGLTTSNTPTYNNLLTATQTNDTNSTSWYGYVVDGAGNINSCSKTLKKDASAPTIPTSEINAINDKTNEITIIPTPNEAKWYNQTLIWKNFNSTDKTSGIEKYEYSSNCTNEVSGTLSSSYTYDTNRDWKFCIRAVDKAGNASAWSKAYYFKIDKTPPECTNIAKKSNTVTAGKDIDISTGSNYTSGSWYSGYVNTSAKCSKDEGGSGCSSTISVTSKGQANDVTDAYKSSRGVDKQGGVEITWKVYDNAGNNTTCSTIKVNLDREAPKISLTKACSGIDDCNKISELANRDSNSKYFGIKFTITDDHSGVEKYKYDHCYKTVYGKTPSELLQTTWVNKNAIYEWTCTSKSLTQRLNDASYTVISPIEKVINYDAFIVEEGKALTGVRAIDKAGNKSAVIKSNEYSWKY